MKTILEYVINQKIKNTSTHGHTVYRRKLDIPQYYVKLTSDKEFDDLINVKEFKNAKEIRERLIKEGIWDRKYVVMVKPLGNVIDWDYFVDRDADQRFEETEYKVTSKEFNLYYWQKQKWTRI